MIYGKKDVHTYIYIYTYGIIGYSGRIERTEIVFETLKTEF